MIREGAVLADVGTDHGYVPIYLLEQKKIKSAIAMDINKGPLERAREHIHLYGMDAYIQTRLSGGGRTDPAAPIGTVQCQGVSCRKWICDGSRAHGI